MNFRRALIGIGVTGAVLVASPLAAAADWTKLGPSAYASNLAVASLRASGATVQAAWTIPDASNDRQVVGATFTPSLASAGRNPQALTLTAGTGPGGSASWSFIDGAVLVPGSDKIAFSSIHSTVTGDPASGDTVASFGVGLPGRVALGADNGLADAVLGPGGTVFYVSAKAGGLKIFSAASPAAPYLDLTGGRTNYIPRFGVAGGKVYVAWYALASPPGQSGLYVAQVDLSNPAASGPATFVPRSSTIDNSGVSLAFACSSAQCRIAYHETGANGLDTGRILTWAPGDAAPAVAVSGSASGVNMGAAYDDDAHLWLAWFDRTAGVYRYTRGNAAGAGGAVGSLGTPTKTSLGGAYAISALDSGPNLVLVTNWLEGNLGNQYATVAAPPSDAGVPDTTGIPNPKVIRRGSAIFVVPKRPSLARLRKTKCVNVRVQSTKPAAVNVAIFSGRKSVRIFGQTVVRFPVPGKKLVCIRVPLRAHTFDVRQPFRFAFAYKLGARPKAKAKATVTTSGFTSFK